MTGAGRYRILGTVQRNTPTRTGAAQVDSWATYFAAFAAISTSGGREFHSARANNSELTHELTIHWRTDKAPRANDRFVVGSRVFDIRAVVNPGELNEEWLLFCQEIT